MWRWTFPLKSNRWNTVKGFYFPKYIFSPVDFSVDLWKLFWIKFAHKCRSHSEHLEATEQENLMTSLRRRRRTQIKNIWRQPCTLNIARWGNPYWPYISWNKNWKSEFEWLLDFNGYCCLLYLTNGDFSESGLSLTSKSNLVVSYEQAWFALSPVQLIFQLCFREALK